ncbi:substrate-binding domain-containing protein [Paucibacter sp. DJ1R-11]|uniref:substrate-binding domain-containing protein n=1 Tax=Paucibacter sp. DJ1R-11 TaxID=2893556 RepID=UPI0021E35CD3|nr:substrate-binding domain-containing protein [Paucibacter sp. DJ1R-11]MCV2362879.1 substrate-binding domain-containing protein [Paucibacter sp. DJ1R-11]
MKRKTKGTQMDKRKVQDLELQTLRRGLVLAPLAGVGLGALGLRSAQAAAPQVVYLTPGLDLPFWRTLGQGVQQYVEARGHGFQVLDSRNSDALQLQNAQAALGKGVAGLVLSPTSSKSAVDVLDLASKARVPVVVADIGTNGGDYVSYVKSDNYKGAYGVGEALAQVMKERGWQGEPYAMCTIALDRKNGQDRTNGFRDAMRDAGFGKELALRQMKTYSTEETYGFVKDLLTQHPKLRGLFVEVDQPTLGALQAIRELKRSNDLLLGSFDGIPEFVDLLRRKALVAVGMQQPLLMGSQAAEALLASRSAASPPAKQILVPVLIATSQNIDQWLPVAKKTVFGSDVK